MAKKLQGQTFWCTAVLMLIPILIAIWVWLSPLAFVPVPWPDDSAFYFVAKELFRWPPRWVMLPQAPFEPTYKIFNFNTMPLYPVLIGLGRLIGIDGSFLLKIWPLGAWALSGSLLGVVLSRAGLPFLGTLLIVLTISLDPEQRWASVLIRPESLIGLLGMALVLGLCLGFPEWTRPKGLWARRLWDPVAFLLALAAYSHFNAIHLLFPVGIAYFSTPKRLLEVGAKTALYLSPWLFAVFFHFSIFLKQMSTQWERLNIRNAWLDSPLQAISSLFQNLGSPEPWPPILNWASAGMWIMIVSAWVLCFVFPIVQFGMKSFNRSSKFPRRRTQNSDISILPAAGWVVGATWLWHTKPEVWFVYYIHVSVWSFMGLVVLRLWQTRKKNRKSILFAVCSMMGAITLAFAAVDLSQFNRLGKTQSWRWSTYYDLIACVDQRLSQLESRLAERDPGRPFRVWFPTFPDITVELSKNHSNWEFTRTNDFWKRKALAIQHGWDTEAVVVTETLGSDERDISGTPDQFPEVQSAWMSWTAYFLYELWKSPGWKPNRYVCQRGRWQAFLYLVDDPK